MRVGVVLIKGCVRGRIAQRASAMTYTSLLSLIPLLIVVLSLIRSLGGFSGLEEMMETFILDTIDPGRQEQVRRWMLSFFQTVRTGAYNGVSILLLMLGGLGLLGSVEGAFNDIWGVHRGRSLFHRFSTYTTIIVFGPLLAGLSLSMTASLKTSAVWHRLSSEVPFGSWFVSLFFQVIPVLLTGIAFTILYVVMPNVRVRLRAALPAGLAAGFIWEISKWGYGLYLERATIYGTLYGSLAAIPLFLLWVYLTWIVVLFGAHLAFAQEAADDIRTEEVASLASLKDRLQAGLHIMMAAAACHRGGLAPPDVAGLARGLGISLRLLRGVAETLVDGRLLHQVASDPRDWALVPARGLERISLMDVWSCFADSREGADVSREDGTPRPKVGPGELSWAQVRSLMDGMERQLEAAWGNRTLADVLDDLPRDALDQLLGRSAGRVVAFPSRKDRA
jgi:membrane protein